MKSKYSSGFPPHRRNLENKFFKRVMVSMPIMYGVEQHKHRGCTSWHPRSKKHLVGLEYHAGQIIFLRSE